jgi:hypothetical protein
MDPIEVAKVVAHLEAYAAIPDELFYDGTKDKASRDKIIQELAKAIVQLDERLKKKETPGPSSHLCSQV